MSRGPRSATATSTTTTQSSSPTTRSRCESRQVFKKVLRNGATGVFQGKILVKPGAQQTDGYQISQALLLDGDSQFLAKPELEIYADDVKCSHGSTSGAIDDEALFYLRIRGVGRSRRAGPADPGLPGRGDRRDRRRAHRRDRWCANSKAGSPGAGADVDHGRDRADLARPRRDRARAAGAGPARGARAPRPDAGLRPDLRRPVAAPRARRTYGRPLEVLVGGALMAGSSSPAPLLRYRALSILVLRSPAVARALRGALRALLGAARRRSFLL